MLNTLATYFNLKSDVDDYDKIHTIIWNGVTFRGTNLWILIFAIVIASVGLNMNSTAVIIGAMLISPLMGPINGMGYSIATYDFPLFRRALKNFAFAVAVSLLASTLYFSISPISAAHSELLARTSPTIYDVLIALFGGLAGIVAISSKHKGNIVPGVAIATALMPPLCTAGYGLAIGELSYFFGALYLFTINAVFIGISSVLISQILNFPIRTLVDSAQRKRVNRWISLIITITIVPSLYFGYRLVEREKFTEDVNRFIDRVSVFEGSYLLKHEMNPGKSELTLIYGGNRLEESHKEQIKELSAAFGLADANLTVEQGFYFDNNIQDEISKIDVNLRGEINRLLLTIQNKEKQPDSVLFLKETGKRLMKEIKPLYPAISACSYAETIEYTDSLKGEESSIVVFKISEAIKKSEREKIIDWLKVRLEKKQVRLFFESE